MTMRTSKKILGVIMALMMLVNVVALGAYAYDMPAMPSGTVCQLILVPENDTYAAGDTVKLTVYGQTSSTTTALEMFGQFIWNYDSNIFELTSASTVPGDHGFAPAASQASAYDEGLSEAWDSATLAGMGEVADSGDSLFGLMISESNDTFVASQTAPVELFSFNLKLKAGIADGDYTIGWNQSSIVTENMFITDEVAYGLFNTDVSVFFPTSTDTVMYSLVDATVHVGAAGPAVSYVKSQVKMTLTGDKSALDTSVAQPIQLRVTSTISDADWDAYLGNTVDKGTATTSAIKSVGIVAYKGAAADFDLDTAKGVAQGTAAANYAYATTTYVQKADDSSDAFFGAIIKGSRADAFAADVTFIGVLEYYDDAGTVKFAFYDAEVTKTISDTTISDYIAAINA